jgi:hypothetical protein
MPLKMLIDVRTNRTKPQLNRPPKIHHMETPASIRRCKLSVKHSVRLTATPAFSHFPRLCLFCLYLHSSLLLTSWRLLQHVWRRGTDSVLSLTRRCHHFNELYVCLPLKQSAIPLANLWLDRQCLRTDKLRTESSIEPRSRRLDKPEERQCVSGAFHQGRTIDDIHDFEADTCL